MQHKLFCTSAHVQGGRNSPCDGQVAQRCSSGAQATASSPQPSSAHLTTTRNRERAETKSVRHCVPAENFHSGIIDIEDATHVSHHINKNGTAAVCKPIVTRPLSYDDDHGDKILHLWYLNLTRCNETIALHKPVANSAGMALQIFCIQPMSAA